VLQGFAVALLRKDAEPYASGRRDRDEGAACRPFPGYSGETLAALIKSGDQDAIGAVLDYFRGYYGRAFHAL